MAMQTRRPTMRLSSALAIIALTFAHPISGRTEDAPVKAISGPAEPTPMSPAATQFIRGMILMLLPPSWSDDDDWGGTRKIQSGLNVSRDGLKIETSRRWKELNHGTWKRVDASLVDPGDHFHLNVLLLPRKERGVPRYRVTGALRLRTSVRQQQWTLGAKLYSVSADVLADLTFSTDLHFRSLITKTDEGNRLRVLPHMESAEVKLTGFNLRRVSHAKGGPVRELGHAFESIVQSAVRRKSDKLADKTNKKIQKKPERFEVPAGILALFGETPRVAVGDRNTP